MTIADYRPDWWDDAACAGLGPDLFFPEANSPYRKSLADEARQVCATCPVRSTCLEYVLAIEEDQPFGIWAGYSHDERQKIKARRKRGPI